MELKSDADVLLTSKFLTLYDELRQQTGENDSFRQADKTAAKMCRRRHHADLPVDSVWLNPDKLLPSTGVSNDG